MLIPIPVFPDVGSIKVIPAFNLPDLSASSIIRKPILSFIEPPGFKNSHFAPKNYYYVKVPGFAI